MFCSLPHRHGDARGKPETRDKTRCSIRTSISCETSKFDNLYLQNRCFPPGLQEKLKLLPQNQCFARDLFQVSSHRTKCHACHGICALSPLRAALKLRCAENTQHDTSEVLRLPRKMKLDTSKVLLWHEKDNTASDNVAPTRQNDFQHITKYVQMPRSAMPATRNKARP